MTAYVTLTNESAIKYVRQINGLFDAEEDLRCAEIGDGNLNLVFHVQGQSGRSVIIKQALPYARIVGEGMPLTVDRSRIEAEAMKAEAECCPQFVPEIYHVDHEMSLIVMEDLSDHVILRSGLIQRNQYPLFAEHISDFLAKTLFYSSDLYLNPSEKKEKVKQFINPELCKISEDLIFSQPFYDAPENNVPPAIRSYVAEHIWNDQALKREAATLKYQFMTQAESLLHGDLHTGSVFVKAGSTKVIDPEFAFYGPMGFDIGAIIANLLLNCIAQQSWSSSVQEQEDMIQYLLDTVTKTWNLFNEKFGLLLANESRDCMFSNPDFHIPLLKRIFRDTLGFAGCKMIRRIHGLAHVADIDTIQDEQERVQAQKLALLIGKTLVIDREKIESIEEVVVTVRNFLKEREKRVTN